MIIYQDGTTTIDVSVQMVTPEMAREWLMMNRGNRALSMKVVRSYADIMDKGCWELNGETISFDEFGELLNGQHRLMAIAKCGKPQLMMVVRGIKSKTFDRNKVRTMTNILEMNGYDTKVRNSAVVGAINYLYVLKYGSHGFSDAGIRNFIDKYSDHITTAYLAGMSGAQHAICKKSPVIAALFCASYCGVSAEVLNEFCTCVNTGFYNGDGQTAAVLARRVIESYANKAATKKEIFDVMLAALSDFMKGQPRRKAYSNLKANPMATRTLQECEI